VLLLVATTAVGYAFRAQRSATEQRDVALARKAISEAAALRDTGCSRRSPSRARTGWTTSGSWRPTRPGGLAVGIDGDVAALRDVADPVRPTRSATHSVDNGGAYAAAIGPSGGGGPVPGAGTGVGHRERGGSQHPAARRRGEPRAAGVGEPGRPHRRDGFRPVGRAVGLADVRNPRRIATVDKQADPVTAVAFSPDGRTLATASRDRTTYVRNVADPARPFEITRPTSRWWPSPTTGGR
jgi:hypothetical protein